MSKLAPFLVKLHDFQNVNKERNHAKTQLFDQKYLSYIHKLYIFGILKTFPRSLCKNICEICTVENDIFVIFVLILCQF